MKNFAILILAAVMATTSGAFLRCQDCEFGLKHEFTDDFYFIASSAEGAVGDVVGIDVSLVVERLYGDIVGFNIVMEFDREALVPLGEPVYSDFFDEFALLPFYAAVGIPGGVLSVSSKRGFALFALVNPGAEEAFLTGGRPFALGTFYFRIRGTPGQATGINFSDEEFYYTPTDPNRCSWLANELNYEPAPGKSIGLHTHSTRHVSALVRILPGEPTHPEPPPMPPEAKVYPTIPTDDSAAIRFELGGAVARPGSTEVAVPFFITSNFEYVGYSFSGKYPTEYLELVRIEQHIRAGAQGILPETGEYWALFSNSRRRLAAEGETVHAATLYFNVKEAAAAVDEVAVTLETVRLGAVKNWLVLRGHASNEQPLTAEVNPFVIVDSRIMLRGGEMALRGDADSSGQLDLTDPVFLLAHLFLGGPAPVCPGAADFNIDSRLDISDPIALLSAMFLGEEAAGAEALREVRCR